MEQAILVISRAVRVRRINVAAEDALVAVLEALMDNHADERRAPRFEGRPMRVTILEMACWVDVVSARRWLFSCAAQRAETAARRSSGFGKDSISNPLSTRRLTSTSNA
jgi:hypothetical protein